ncbi:MAG: hypothetical protein JWM68_1180 [Verrucomicrobiales bacterium]|nr:hypothetical protein [Verrucomicrobiales bacterium]
MFGAVAAAMSVQGSADYGPAIWRPLCEANWYTSGYGHKFHVVHDMEGYYASTVSWFSSCGMRSASVHYAINGLQDAGSDAPQGEITQLGVTEANYAWHALCWNQHSTGTEHEGFANNPAWYTEPMYQASAGLTRHIADKFGYARDRNHIVAHGQKLVAGWSAWASANLGIDPNCNSHTDPGPYWDWNHYMTIINGINPPYGFDTDVQGWTAGNGEAATWWAGSGWPGVLVTDQTGNDGYVLGPSCSYTAPGYGPCISVNVYPQSGGSANHDMQIFWTTTAEPFFDAAKSSPVITYTAQNNWMRLNFNVNQPKFYGQTITQLRLDFDNTSVGTRWIVNDIWPENTSPIWFFGADINGWTPGNAMSALAWADASWGGAVYGDQTGNDAYIFSPAGLNYLSGQNDLIHVRVYPQNGTTASHDMQVFWIGAGESWDAAKSSAVVNFSAQNGWADVYIPVGANPNWVHWIHQIRLDFDQTNHGTRWIVDYVGVEHQTSPVTVAVADTIIDNTGATVTGTWASGTSSTDKYGADYRYHSKGSGANYLTYTPNIATAGNYKVYEWHPQGSNRSSAAPHVIAYNGGTVTVNVNQQVGGGTWNLLGTFNFATGTAGNVKITDGFTDAGINVMADAVKFVYVP